MARRYTLDDFEPTDEEIAAARVVGEGGQTATGVGNAIGSVAGGALGALGFIGGPAVGAATTGLGLSLGGQLGGMVGSNVAEGSIRAAEGTLAKGAEEKLRKQEAMRGRLAALQQLIAQGR